MDPAEINGYKKTLHVKHTNQLVVRNEVPQASDGYHMMTPLLATYSSHC